MAPRVDSQRLSRRSVVGSVPNRHHWERAWACLDSFPNLGNQGFFSPAVESLIAYSSGIPDAKTLRELSSQPILLLRGASGSGKTVAMQQEAARLETDGRRVVWIDLATATELPTDELSAAARRRGTSVFIDGLDIALLSRPTIADELGRLLFRLMTAHKTFSLRIAIRSGVRVDSLVAELSRIANSEATELTITPLSIRDVEHAARREGVDPERFLRYVDAIRAGPLASQPPTLAMLFALSREEQTLPKRRDRLYDAGCLELARELNATRLSLRGGDDEHFVGKLEPKERLAVAGRLAALMVFGDHTTIDLSHRAGDSVVLRAEEACGGVEIVEQRIVAVNRACVREVVRTGLFRSAGEDAYVFIHSSFMQFLAARYLNSKGMSAIQILSLLQAGDRSIGQIAANRLDIASWLAALDARLFEILADLDPQAVLRSGIPALSSDSRMRLADALIRDSAKDQVDLEHLERTGDLVLVSNPLLPPRLASLIKNRALPLSQRLFSALLAKDCQPEGISGDFLSVAIDKNEAFDLRAAALVALTRMKIGPERKTLLAIARDGLPKDPNHHLQRMAVIAIYPRIATPGEVIRLLTPPRAKRIISNDAFFSVLFFKYLTKKHLPDSLEAITELCRLRYNDGGVLKKLLVIISGTAKRALAFLSDSNIRDALAKMILAIPDDLMWASWSDTLHNRGMPPEVSDDLRRSLILKIVESARNGKVAKTLLEIPFLLLAKDLRWLTVLATSERGIRRSIFCTLAVELARQYSPTGKLPGRLPGLTNKASADVIGYALAMPANFAIWTPPSILPDVASNYGPVSEPEKGLERNLVVRSMQNELADFKLLQIERAITDRPLASRIDSPTVLELAADSERRLVRGNSDLLEVVQESLARAQVRLKGPTAMVRALWNETPNSAEPKDENFLSDFITDHLRSDLVRSGVIADREVEIRPRVGNTTGQRTDIRIQAFKKGLSGTGRQQIASLILEAKGCWNIDLYGAAESQLRDRYMKTVDHTAGIYLVGWYICKEWKRPKLAGRVERRASELFKLRERLTKQAAALSKADQPIGVHVLDVTLS